MGRPALPMNVHILKGTDKVNPGRLKARENEPVNIHPIGEAPGCLTEIEKAAFDEIVSLVIPDVLGLADKLAVEQAAKLLVKCRGQAMVYDSKLDKDVAYQATAQEQNLYFKYLGQFGMTPSERSKISVPKKKPENKFDD